MTSRSLDSELCALLACALAPAGINLSPALTRLCGTSFPDARLVERAARYQLRPQVAARLPELASSVPADALRTFTAANRGHALLMAGEALLVLDQLCGAGIPVVPFKGPVFASFVGQDPEGREMNDLDFILQPRDVTAAVRALAPLGYTTILPNRAVESPWLTTATSELGLIAHNGVTLLELHWQLSPSWFPAPCSVADVMAGSSPRPFMHGQVIWPSAEELLLVHVSDGLKSCGNGLRWISDIAHILRSSSHLDWTLVRRLAAERDGLSSLCVALAVVDGLAEAVARMLDEPALALALPPAAKGLAKVAERTPRLHRAVDSIDQRLSADFSITGVGPQFLWAFRLGDRPARAGAAIARHVTMPTVSDLAAAQYRDADSTMRWRALRRRAFSRRPAA